jgi:hypothetical protein
VSSRPWTSSSPSTPTSIAGTLSCFDRVIFRGYLPFFSGAAMASFLEAQKIPRHELKSFLLEQAARLKTHAYRMAEQAGRPFQYLAQPTKMETLARELAERDGIQDGLVCIYSVLEPCRTYSLRWNQPDHIQPAKRKCLFLYYYFMDRELGLIHVKLQTWFPMQLQIYLNGHEWLAHKLARHAIRYSKLDNVFLWVEDFPRAQTFADRFVTVDWVATLQRYAPAGQSAAGRSAPPPAVLLGERPGRIRHRPRVQEPPGAARLRPTPPGVQHLLLHPAGCDDLPGP